MLPRLAWVLESRFVKLRAMHTGESRLYTYCGMCVAKSAPGVHLKCALCRERAKRLVRHLQSRESETAIEMLERDASLAWVRDDECGGYPLHVAAYQACRTLPFYQIIWLPFSLYSA